MNPGDHLSTREACRSIDLMYYGTFGAGMLAELIKLMLRGKVDRHACGGVKIHTPY